MKKLLFAAGLLCFGLSTTTLFAQEIKQPTTSSQTKSRLDPKRMAAMKANRLENELSLTADQKAKVEEILSSVTMTGDRQIVEKETEQKIRAILTPEQNKKYDEMIAKREEMKKQRHDANGAK